MSYFYGLRACEIFSVSVEGRKNSWHVHQLWLNFLGSLVGWVAAWALLRALVACAAEACSLSVTPSAVLVFFLAFIGVTGHLPAAVVGLVGGVSESSPSYLHSSVVSREHDVNRGERGSYNDSAASG